MPGCLGDGGDVLDLDSILADHACGGLHRVESPGAASGVIYIEEADVFAVGGPSEGLSDAV